MAKPVTCCMNFWKSFSRGAPCLNIEHVDMWRPATECAARRRARIETANPRLQGSKQYVTSRRLLPLLLRRSIGDDKASRRSDFVSQSNRDGKWC
jgi:hypothetical protein